MFTQKFMTLGRIDKGSLYRGVMKRYTQSNAAKTNLVSEVGRMEREK